MKCSCFLLPVCVLLECEKGPEPVWDWEPVERVYIFKCTHKMRGDDAHHFYWHQTNVLKTSGVFSGLEETELVDGPNNPTLMFGFQSLYCNKWEDVKVPLKKENVAKKLRSYCLPRNPQGSVGSRSSPPGLPVLPHTDHPLYDISFCSPAAE